MLDFRLLLRWAQDGVSEHSSRTGYWSERTTHVMVRRNPPTYLVFHGLQTLSTFVISCNPYNSLTREAFFQVSCWGWERWCDLTDKQQGQQGWDSE